MFDVCDSLQLACIELWTLWVELHCVELTLNSNCSTFFCNAFIFAIAFACSLIKNKISGLRLTSGGDDLSDDLGDDLSDDLGDDLSDDLGNDLGADEGLFDSPADE